MKCIFFITKTTKIPKSTYLSPLLLHNEHSAKDVAVVPDLQAPTKTKTPLLNT